MDPVLHLIERAVRVGGAGFKVYTVCTEGEGARIICTQGLTCNVTRAVTCGEGGGRLHPRLRTETGSPTAVGMRVG